MSIESVNDPRTALVQTKYFSLHPKPLERWLWQQGLPQAAERVFWLHWDEGMRNQDWCSEVPIKRVARECCVDPSTVTRAYQMLKTKGLIRRQDPGRDTNNPFAQATAITEIRLPCELLVDLSRSPNRSSARSEVPTMGAAVATATAATKPVKTARTPSRAMLTREESRQMWSRVSAAERARFYSATQARSSAFECDADSRLSPNDRAELLAQLADQAAANPEVSQRLKAASPKSDYAGPRRLSVLELARARHRLSECVPAGNVSEVLRQVIWAIEEGALRRFAMPLALNIALKKIRDGAWSKPNRIPPNWVPRNASSRARVEQCSAA